jgi:diacylglycerol O-acyltransferase
MARLGGIDANFLYFETPETPMHVAGFTLYNLPEGYQGTFYDNFRALMESRVHLIPVFSKKLAPVPLDLHHPSWVDDPAVDLDYHIRRETLPSPGTFEQMEDRIAELHSMPMDRTRPLWQFIVIEGMANGQVALYSKVHHAAVDGGAGMVITSVVYDVTREPRKVPPPQPKAEPAPNPAGAMGDLVASVVRQQVNMMRAAPEFMSAVTNLFFPKLGRDSSLGDLLPKSPVGSVPSLLAPKTPFNVSISGQRAYAARSLSLADAKAIGKATGAKMNDVVMAICSGALRRYLQGKGALPKDPLIAFVPISLREFGNTDINNQVFGMMCNLATDVADPVQRLRAIQSHSSDSKTVAGSFKDIVPQDYAFFGAPLLLRGLSELYGKSGLADLLPMAANVVISNTPGPQVPLYGAGAMVDALYPVSIPAHGCALNMTVQSYLGDLDFGLTADRRAVPDVKALGDLLVESFDELRSALRIPAAPAEPGREARQ